MNFKALFTILGGLMMFYSFYVMGYWSGKEGFDVTLLGPIGGMISFYFFGIKAMGEEFPIGTLIIYASYCIGVGIGLEAIVLIFYALYL